MLDLTKPITTRDGRPARIICMDRNASNGYSIVALVQEHLQTGTEECIYSYTKEGKFHGEVKSPHRADLVNPKVKKEGWVNVYSNERYIFVGRCSDVYPSIEKAREHANPDRKACVRIEWEE